MTVRYGGYMPCVIISCGTVVLTASISPYMRRSDGRLKQVTNPSVTSVMVTGNGNESEIEAN